MVKQLAARRDPITRLPNLIFETTRIGVKKRGLPRRIHDALGSLSSYRRKDSFLHTLLLFCFRSSGMPWSAVMGFRARPSLAVHQSLKIIR